MSTYLWIDLSAFLIPFVCSFHPRLRFHRTWHALWPALLGMMALFLPWDAWFTRRGIWGFNPEHLAGPAWHGLPLEEVLFFICIPYACLFTFHSLRKLGVKDHFGRHSGTISWAMAAALVPVIVFFPGRAYTAATLGALALWLLLLQTWLKPRWLGRAYFTFLVLLPPFLAVDGILTGCLLHKPVVWYDERAILGPRIGTIPVEDLFYALLMFLVVLAIYEALLARGSQRAR